MSKTNIYYSNTVPSVQVFGWPCIFRAIHDYSTIPSNKTPTSLHGTLSLYPHCQFRYIETKQLGRTSLDVHYATYTSSVVSLLLLLNEGDHCLIWGSLRERPQGIYFKNFDLTFDIDHIVFDESYGLLSPQRAMFCSSNAAELDSK